VLVIDLGSERLYNVLVDDHNLRASVEDCWNMDAVVNNNIDFLERETKGGWLDDGWKMWSGVGVGVVHGGASHGLQLQVSAGGYFILVGLHVLQLKFFSNVFVDDGAGGEDVGGHHESELALHEILLKL